jgi:hypothetical protein
MYEYILPLNELPVWGPRFPDDEFATILNTREHLVTLIQHILLGIVEPIISADRALGLLLYQQNSRAVSTAADQKTVYVNTDSYEEASEQ